MPNVLDRVLTGDKYNVTSPPCTFTPIGGVKQISWSEGGTGDFYAQFWIPNQQNPGKWSLEQFEHYYPASNSGAFATGVAGVQFRSATPGQPATISGDQLFTNDPIIFSGSPSTAVIRATGMVTGIVDSSGATIQGSGFTGSAGGGQINIVFNTPFSSPPTPIAWPSNNIGVDQLTLREGSLSTAGFSAYVGGASGMAFVAFATV